MKSCIMKIARHGGLFSIKKNVYFNLRLLTMVKPRFNDISKINDLPKIYRSLSLSRSSLALISARNVSSQVDIKEEIDLMVKNNKVVLFMKGVPEAPKCGFSNAVVQILRMHGVKYESHDVLEDERLRQGIKEYSNWPTIPQVFVNGEFVGGCDVMLQLHQNGELIEELQKAGITSALLDEKDPKNTHK